MIVVDSINFAEPKTKLVVGMLSALNVAETKALIITGQQDEIVEKSARNIPGVKTIVSNCLNVYDLLYHGKLLITKEAISKIEEVLA
ncbi:MAG: rplD [Firmicutes bacterium]|nr:rplD [Bacillota bacterium]